MTSYYQTAHLYLKAIDVKVLTYRPTPIMPAAAEKMFAAGYNIKVRRLDGVSFEWYLSGDIYEMSPNGDWCYYPAKPTLGAAVKHGQPLLGRLCYIFHPGGAVSRHHGQHVFHWSNTEFPREREVGQIMTDHWCDDRLRWDDDCEFECEPGAYYSYWS
jgi:hypothetical protein